jgi:hypothetical protein
VRGTQENFGLDQHWRPVENRRMDAWTHGRERNYAQRSRGNAQRRKGIGPAMTTSKVIFDLFAGDVFADCVTRIVGSVGEESVYCDASITK